MEVILLLEVVHHLTWACTLLLLLLSWCRWTFVIKEVEGEERTVHGSVLLYFLPLLLLIHLDLLNFVVLMSLGKHVLLGCLDVLLWHVLV